MMRRFSASDLRTVASSRLVLSLLAVAPVPIRRLMSSRG